MSVTVPPQPKHDEVEALIEEARERARRRRLRAAAAVLVLAVIGVGVSGAIIVTAHGSGTDGLPEGFQLVHARGPVEHAQIEWYSTGQMEQRVVDVSTGTQRRAPIVFDVWWDRGRNLFRAVAKVDGRVQSDTAGRPCQTATGFGRRCLPPKPFDLRRVGYTWPVDPTIARVTGRGDFRGHDVIWVQRLARAGGGMREPPVALDARTHRPVGTRFVVDGKVFDAQVYRFLGTVPAAKVSFLVPDDGVPRSYLSSLNSFPYGFGPRVSAGGSERASLREARDVLDRNLLWLGPSFQGHPLRLVQTVTEGAWAGRRLPGSARAVLLDYGVVMLEEFGRERPFSEHGPQAGRMVATGLPPVATLNRNGLLVHADLGQFATWHMSSRFAAQDAAKARAGALAVARGLRPLPPAGDKALRDLGSPTASFVDPVGDAGRPPDISRLEITPAAGDQLEFSVTVAGQRCVGFGGSGGPMIAIDRDQNPDTGSGYYGTEVALTTDSGGPQLRRADGWDLRPAPQPAGAIPPAGPSGPYGSCEGKRFELFVPLKVIGVGPRTGFNVVVAAFRSQTDTAPDIGTFNYQQVRGKAPPKPGPDTRPPHVAAFYAERPNSRTVRLGYWVLDGRGAIGETFRVYRGRRLLATIRRPVRESKPFGFAYLDWRVPRGVRGPLRFTLRAVDAAGNRSTLSSTTG
jgi:hypothetical protein